MDKNDLIIKIESILADNNSLLEIAKTYCEYNSGNIAEISTLIPLLEITLKNQRIIINSLDDLINC